MSRKQSFHVFGTGVDRPSAYILSQHPSLHPVEWVPGGFRQHLCVFHLVWVLCVGGGGGIALITLQRLLDQSHAGPYIEENATHTPFWAFLGLFVYPTSRS